jgi:glycosyltransferase involved in cell wall biosynthesis
MYVETNSGWVSDRSICYLAAGRPVVAQDTGLANRLPTDEGLLTFRSIEEGAEAVRAVRREPSRHRRAARQVAEAYFDSSTVLASLVRKLGLH